MDELEKQGMDLSMPRVLHLVRGMVNLIGRQNASGNIHYFKGSLQLFLEHHQYFFIVVITNQQNDALYSLHNHPLIILCLSLHHIFEGFIGHGNAKQQVTHRGC